MTFPKTFLAGAAAFAVSIVLSMSAASAQTPASSASMAGMDMSAASGNQGDSASTKEFQAADHSMMSGMSGVEYTGDADHDFVSHMIPHHEGAVAMAKVELKYGKDAKLRALAKEIIASQDKEIAFMKRWLATHPQKK
uniref:CopM family metallochaperone n=1 Tax=Caballeronia sp. LjRoot34 TaxID=3342325 RepID=UPI003F50531B